MMRRDWIEKVAYTRIGLAEDYDLWLRLYLAGARFAKVPEILLLWREHPQRLTCTDDRYSLENFLKEKPLPGARTSETPPIYRGLGSRDDRSPLSRYLIARDATAGFVDIDPKKIGRTRHGLP